MPGRHVTDHQMAFHDAQTDPFRSRGSGHLRRTSGIRPELLDAALSPSELRP